MYDVCRVGQFPRSWFDAMRRVKPVDAYSDSDSDYEVRMGSWSVLFVNQGECILGRVHPWGLVSVSTYVRRGRVQEEARPLHNG